MSEYYLLKMVHQKNVCSGDHEVCVSFKTAHALNIAS